MAEHLDLFLAALLRGENADWPPDWNGDDAESLWDRVRFHGIAYFVAEHLARTHGWPESLQELVRREAQLQAFWEETHRAMLRGVHTRLSEARIAALVMKGSALAYSLYPQPAARRRGDTDLLVGKRDLRVTRAVLREFGFHRRHDPHGLSFQESWLYDTGIGMTHALDLHWQPSEFPIVQQALSTPAYFEQALPLPQLADTALMPGLVQSFVQCAINHAWHGRHGLFVDGESRSGSGRLIGVMDSALLAAAFSQDDWRHLVRLARKHGLAAICLDALRLAQDRLGAQVPAKVLGELELAPRDTKAVRRLHEGDLVRGFLADLRAIPAAGDKVRFVLGHAFPPSAHLRMKYPERRSWPVALLHLRRIGEAMIRLGRVRSGR